ncbi:MAG: hypothetical protein WBQ95_21540, partial [Terracidiphilus sp.]
PSLVLLITLMAMWVSANLGAFVGHWMRPLKDEEREDFGTVLTATLTLLGLLIGFTFSMAISRYDQRKNLEEEEANAIGTEYVRVDVLPAADAGKAKDLLRKYLDQRILFYKSRDENELVRINATTGRLQNDLWAVVRGPAEAQPTAVTSLALSGMNDVLNSQGYTTAAWLNRIPVAAWLLMRLIALGSNFLIGYGARRRDTVLLLIVPIAVSLSFFLVADIDSPREGLISVQPQNLVILSDSLGTN